MERVFWKYEYEYRSREGKPEQIRKDNPTYCRETLVSNIKSCYQIKQKEGGIFSSLDVSLVYASGIAIDFAKQIDDVLRFINKEFLYGSGNGYIKRIGKNTIHFHRQFIPQFISYVIYLVRDRDIPENPKSIHDWTGDILTTIFHMGLKNSSFYLYDSNYLPGNGPRSYTTNNIGALFLRESQILELAEHLNELKYLKSSMGMGNNQAFYLYLTSLINYLETEYAKYVH